MEKIATSVAATMLLLPHRPAELPTMGPTA